MLLFKFVEAMVQGFTQLLNTKFDRLRSFDCLLKSVSCLKLFNLFLKNFNLSIAGEVLFTEIAVKMIVV